MKDIEGKLQAEDARPFAKRMVQSAAAKHVEKFRKILGGFEERGILHSEMLAVCSICEELKTEVILESGRARGQSTLILAKYFENSPVKILSVNWKKAEWFSRADDDFACQRLAGIRQSRGRDVSMISIGR